MNRLVMQSDIFTTVAELCILKKHSLANVSTKTRLPITMGDDDPAPGRSKDQTTCSLLFHSTGTAESAMPCPVGPRNRLQSSADTVELKIIQMQTITSVLIRIFWVHVYVLLSLLPSLFSPEIPNSLTRKTLFGVFNSVTICFALPQRRLLEYFLLLPARHSSAPECSGRCIHRSSRA